MWGLGCLIWEVFNGPLTQQSSLKNIDRVRQFFIIPLYCSDVFHNIFSLLKLLIWTKMRKH